VSEFAARYGPWAVVAGASEGLGAAFARELARRGLNLVLLARRRDALDELAASLKVEVRAVAMDLSRPDLAGAIDGALADLDVGLLVYNAAYAPIGAFADVPLADKLRVVDVNCRGPVTLASAVAPRLRRRGRGGIVLMSSLTAFFGSPRLATYGATKAFNLVLAEGLWFELRARGVDVLACAAGATLTPGFRKASPAGEPGMLEPAQVVEEALERLGRTGVMIPGAFNRFASFLMRRVLPRRMAVGILGNRTRNLALP
jgi:hypothetical protein